MTQRSQEENTLVSSIKVIKRSKVGVASCVLIKDVWRKMTTSPLPIEMHGNAINPFQPSPQNPRNILFAICFSMKLTLFNTVSKFA